LREAKEMKHVKIRKRTALKELKTSPWSNGNVACIYDKKKKI
jgi:hypothetical protein